MINFVRRSRQVTSGLLHPRQPVPRLMPTKSLDGCGCVLPDRHIRSMVAEFRYIANRGFDADMGQGIPLPYSPFLADIILRHAFRFQNVITLRLDRARGGWSWKIAITAI